MPGRQHSRSSVSSGWATRTSRSTARRATTASSVLSRLPFEIERGAGVLRQERLPPHLGRARRARGAQRSDHTAQFLRARRRRHSRSRGRSKIRPQARLPRRDARTAPRCARRRRSARSSSATSMWRRSNATSGATSSCSGSSRTRRSSARSFSACRRPATGSMPCAASCRSRRRFSPGGATARRTGPVRSRPPARPHLGRAGARRPLVGGHGFQGFARLVAAVRPRAGDGDARGLAIDARRRYVRRAWCAIERVAHVFHFARPLVVARQDDFAQAPRRVRIAFEHFQEHRPRQAHDGRILARGGGGRPLRLGEEGQFADQGPRPGDDLVLAGRSGRSRNEPCCTT